MNARWLVSIGAACVGAVVTYQTLFCATVKEAGLFLQLVLYVGKAVLVMAAGRPHPKATN